MYFITGFTKSTISSLNAWYLGYPVSDSFNGSFVSFQITFPTGIVVSIFLFPLLSSIVPAAITIFVSPFVSPKFPNVNVYPTFTSSAFALCKSDLAINVCSSVLSVIFVNVFVIEVCSTSSTYTLILLNASFIVPSANAFANTSVS